MKSERREHFNANWRIRIKRCDSYLRLKLCCSPIIPVADKWSIGAKLDFKVIGSNYKTLTSTTEHCFNDQVGSESEYIQWDDVEKFLVDDNLVVEVEVVILKVTGFGNEEIRPFDDSQKDFSDVILVVKDTKFYVLKKFLASQSSYFKALLLGNFAEAGKSEVELKEVDPEEFQIFLEVLHGELAINDTTVEGVASLGDMYDAPTAIRRCEKFLLEKSLKTLKEKIRLACRHRLEKLKEKCMRQIETIEDVQSLIPDNINELDHQTTFDILVIMNSLL
ncbi:hypothetical protein L3Y34_013915 [Caenorhabditis briggsae]|uniref:BTB domain-containing protein n=1 Tax=Caenorhabditis briggsae TaxID=6238 RepID=A0AAE9DQN8_CAEBR|nr:hypothetical protein L3Y34_013915 [Caenorhabditis briggsae]